MNELSVLPMEIELSIIKRIQQIFEKEKLEESFPNALLREDALDLLDKFCTVVYFPIPKEKNNGFHITDVPFSNGNIQNFVFINTAQTMEKQVFTAAHELGHIWEIDKFVISDLDLTDSPELKEMIINRFAAVLLIPKDKFKLSVSTNLKEYQNENNTITINDLLKVIVILMNHFFVPMKAIVLRLLELDIITQTTAEVLLGYAEISQEDIECRVQDLIREFDFIKFQNPSMKKWIEGLSEILEKAEKEKLVSQEKINHMREQFDLKPLASINDKMENTLSFNPQEGFDK